MSCASGILLGGQVAGTREAFDASCSTNRKLGGSNVVQAFFQAVVGQVVRSGQSVRLTTTDTKLAGFEHITVNVAGTEYITGVAPTVGLWLMTLNASESDAGPLRVVAPAGGSAKFNLLFLQDDFNIEVRRGNAMSVVNNTDADITIGPGVSVVIRAL